MHLSLVQMWLELNHLYSAVSHCFGDVHRYDVQTKSITEINLRPITIATTNFDEADWIDLSQQSAY